MFFPKAVLALTLVLSASALTTPHIARNVHHHRSIAVRHAEPEPVVQPEPVVVKPKRKRNLNKRCAVGSSSAAVPSSSAVASSAVPSSVFSSAPVPSVSILPSSSVIPSSVVSSSVFSTSSEPAESSAPVNVGGAPPTFSSSEVAPTSSAAPPPPPPPSPTPTPTPTPTPSSTEAAPAPTSSAADSGLSWLVGPNTGDATYYAAGLGACGITNSDSDYIVAVSWELFDNYPGYDGTNPNNNPVCGKQITANYQGKTVTVEVTDRCTGCDVTSLDFTPTAFQQMADLSIGRLYGMTWNWT